MYKNIEFNTQYEDNTLENISVLKNTTYDSNDILLQQDDNELTDEEVEETIQDAKSETFISEVEPLISAYIKQLKEYPLLTEEEEKIYGNMYRNGNEMEKKYAKDIMITHNLRLVISVAKRYNFEKISLEDLIQEGNIGLIAAVERYDPSVGRFSTYAVHRIRQSIQRFRMNNARTIRLPCHVLEQNNRIVKAVSELESSGEKVDVNALAIKTGLKPETIQKYQTIMPDPVSLNQLISGDNDNATELGEFVADSNMVDPADIYMDATKNSMIEDLMSVLSDREKAVVKYYYGLGDIEPGTLETVGAMLGVTRERVRQIRCNALRKMKNPKYAKKYEDYIKEL